MNVALALATPVIAGFFALLLLLMTLAYIHSGVDLALEGSRGESEYADLLVRDVALLVLDTTNLLLLRPSDR